MTRRLVLIVSVVLVAGCAPPMQFTKPDATDEELRRDVYECRQQGLTAGSGNVFIARTQMIECMTVRGWTLQ
jgi:hypothetical protein